MEYYGKELRKARLQKGLNQKQAVEKLKEKGVILSQSHLSKIENNERTPKLDITLALCDLYDISIEDLRKTKEKPVIVEEEEENENLAKDEKALLKNYRRLDDYDKKIVKHMAKYLDTNSDFPLEKEQTLKRMVKYHPDEDILIAAHGSENADEEEMKLIEEDIADIKALHEKKKK